MTTDTTPEIYQNYMQVNQSLFLSSADANSYIEGTITGPTTTPRGYMLDAQGTVHCCNRQLIFPIHTDTTPFLRPSLH